MEKLVDSGKARSIGEFIRLLSISTDKEIGISNFNILKTKRVLEVARIIPAVNQVEIHPYATHPVLRLLSH